MRNVIYISLTTFALTACSAINPAQQNNTQHANHGQYNSPSNSQYNNPYNSQYNPQGQYANQTAFPQQYTPAQTPQYSQVNSYNQTGHQATQYGQANQTPALRGSQKAPKFRGYIYGTLGLVNYDTGVDNYGIEGRVGYQATKHFGAEVEGSFSVANDDDTFTDPLNINREVTTATGFNHNAAVFAVARLPVSDRIALHARGGYDFRSFDIDVEDNLGNTDNFSQNLDGFAYGLGGEYALTERNRIRVDYTLYETEIGRTDAISLSYKTKF